MFTGDCDVRTEADGDVFDDNAELEAAGEMLIEALEGRDFFVGDLVADTRSGDRDDKFAEK